MPEELIEPGRLYGTWKLIESRAVDANGKPIRDPWGPAPMGRLVIEPTGRMMAVLCDGRIGPIEGPRHYSSYCGSFTFAGGVLATTVDAASDPSRIGSVQRRMVALDAGRLVLRPPAREDGESREIIWELEAPWSPDQ